MRCCWQILVFAPLAWGLASVTTTKGAASSVAVATETVLTAANPKTIAVAGATGRMGQFVVQELLERGMNVKAIVRDIPKAQQLFLESDEDSKNENSSKDKRLELVECDLSNEESLMKSLVGTDAAIWCASAAPPAATAATDTNNNNISKWLSKIKQFFGIVQLATPPNEQSIDIVGMRAIGKAYATAASSSKPPVNDALLPQVVMCSSAGVTRPTWDEHKKQKYPGAADIPIVRLNPFSILDRKRESENELRNSGVPYCIVRPCGLNDNWPVGSRPVFSQGDVAVGRIHRQDVAQILVDVLSIPEATGKTFEVVGLAGYPRPTSLRPVLERMYTDKDMSQLSEEFVYANYATAQQLLPGEKQDSAALAMGQTYEQLDRSITGRLGERGTENAEAALIQSSSSSSSSATKSSS
jgi:uncharacterized protein YbjT (DUF2867 family)